VSKHQSSIAVSTWSSRLTGTENRDHCTQINCAGVPRNFRIQVWVWNTFVSGKHCWFPCCQSNVPARSVLGNRYDWQAKSAFIPGMSLYSLFLCNSTKICAEFRAVRKRKSKLIERIRIRPNKNKKTKNKNKKKRKNSYSSKLDYSTQNPNKRM